MPAIRFPRLILAFIASLVVATCTACAPAQEKVKISFVVTVPSKTPSADTLYLCGNLKEVGNWDGHGAALTRQENGEYTVTLDLPRGEKLEYKLSRGSWETVEKATNGDEMGNRTVDLDADKTVNVKVETWRDQASPGAPTKPSTTGDVRYHEKFHSKILDNDRKLIVWLPPEYEKDSSARYPVLYLHDGQNVFDDATSFGGEWHADETATKLIEDKRIVPIIIVGVENIGKNRITEYTPTRAEDPDTEEEDGSKKLIGGGGEQYSRFLIEEVKPFIDQTYRTQADRAHTAVAGSSLGGLISLYIGWKHGDVFGMCGALSPSLWWDERAMLITFEADNAWMKRQRLWIDFGTAERSAPADMNRYLANSRELHAICQRAGLKDGQDCLYKEFEGAAHNEKAWSARFDQVLVFFFGVK